MLEPGSTLPFDAEVPQKHPHRGHDHPDRGAAVVPTPLLDEVAKPAGRERPRVVPEEADEIVGIGSVRDQRTLDDAPVDAPPSEEPLDPSDGLRASLDLNDSALAQMPEKPAHPWEHLWGAIA
jgi:hypothetical protein